MSHVGNPQAWATKAHSPVAIDYSFDPRYVDGYGHKPGGNGNGYGLGYGLGYSYADGHGYGDCPARWIRRKKGNRG